MTEYILALLLTSGIIYLAYRVGKRAGIKEEQLRVLNEKDKEWEQFISVVSSNGSINDTDVNAWLQERAKKSNTIVSTKI